MNYDYLVTGEISKIRENSASSGVGVLASYAYDALGTRTSVTFGNGSVESYAYDPVSRLKTLTNDLTGTANDLTIGGSTTSIAYNAASQITSAPRSNSAYAWTGSVSVNRSYASNGLNQYTAAGPASFTYDANGNLTSDGTSSYGYSSENLLTSAPGASLAYDPFDRLYQVAATSTTRFAYDGLNLIAEYDGSNKLQDRYVFAPGLDQPIVDYQGTGTNSPLFLSTDERGSIVSLTTANGSMAAIDSYDEYGIPGSSNSGRFQYTGQAWLPELGMYYYKARVYSPTLGRFMQTDPLGYGGDGPNLYAYVLNDSVNYVDPLGLEVNCGGIIADVCGHRNHDVSWFGFFDHEILDSDPSPTLKNWESRWGEAGGAASPRNDNATCKGPVATYSKGGSLTVVGFAGGNAGVTANLSVPLHLNWSNPFKGVQLSFTFQAAYIEGLGAFAGYGETNGIGVSRSHAPTGRSSSHYAYAEADFGAGEAVGASIQGNRSGASGAIGRKVGEGAGIFAGGGIGKSWTFALKPFGC